VQSDQERIVQAVLAFYPRVEAVYLFGSFGTDGELPGSDADIAILLPPREAAAGGALGLIETRFALEKVLGREVDLVNLRRVPTVLQKEVILAERRIYFGDSFAADTFEMLVLSLYQKLNEERRGILEEGLRSGRFFAA
jgi:predicted nucleotidyltransferase